jgi:energy-coupling factor transporter ATP-binding protein EcfA2
VIEDGLPVDHADQVRAVGEGDGTLTDMAVKVEEQNLAVFGESGSGKTVLLSSFYGATQESSFLADSLYKVLADDTGQGRRLRQNYLRMREQAEAPATPRRPRQSPSTLCASSGMTSRASGSRKNPAAPRRQRAGSRRSPSS